MFTVQNPHVNMGRDLRRGIKRQLVFQNTSVFLEIETILLTFFYQLRGFGTTCLLQSSTNIIPFFKITRLTAQNFSVLKTFYSFFIAFYIWANKKFALLSTRASPSERRRIVLRSSNCFRMFSSNLENHFRLDPERGKSLDHARFRGHLWKVYLLIPLP